MNKEYITILLKDNYAYIQNEEYEKEKIIKKIKVLKQDSSKFKIEKEETEKKLVYSLSFEKSKEQWTVHLKIPKKYIENNEQQIEILDTWYHNYNQKKYLQTLKAILIVATISVGGIAFKEPIMEKFNSVIEHLKDTTLPDEIDNLEREISIHSGHYYDPAGRFVYPYYGHGCVLSSDKTISVPDRIKLYCEEHDLEYLEEDALQKYAYLYNDQMELGNAIDLREIKKEEQKKLKKD